MSRPNQNQNQQRQGGGAASPATSNPQSQDLTSLIGSPLRLTLSNNSIITGSLWAYDSSLATLALETGVQQPSVSIPSHAAASPSPTILNPTSLTTPTSTTKSTGFRIIKTREISNIEVMNLSKDQEPSKDLQFVKSLTAIHPVNVEGAKRREELAVKEGKLRAGRKGKDVSQLGQDVFDALSKTLPCRWYQKHIIVLEEVVISGPNYDTSSTNVPGLTHEELRRLAENPSSDSNGAQGKAKANSWTRVIKVLEGERKRILARQSGLSSSPAPSPVPSSSQSVAI